MVSVRALRKITISGLILLALGLVESGCRRQTTPAEEIPSRADIWREIQPLADRYRMDATFIYALVAAESNFDPRARNGDARGLMQLKEVAWQTVRKDPYEPAVWEWKRNLAAGVEFVAWCRSYLHQRNKFSYPVLLASFHYGIDYVQDREFDLGRLDPPESTIYRELWRGNLSPVKPPKT